MVRDGATGVDTAAMRSVVDNVASLCLVKECKELEEDFGTQFTDKMLPDQHERGEEGDWAARQREED